MSAEKMTTTKLEPRVAKLEVGLDRLTDDVRDLATIVRSQGSQMEQEIQKLVVAVTQAAGPRKTDWSTIIAAVMMVMAIGAAVLIPLNQTAQDNKAAIERYHDAMVEHTKLDNHPVGAALIIGLDERVKRIETRSANETEHDRQELMLWRQRAMGLSPVNVTVTNK